MTKTGSEMGRMSIPRRKMKEFEREREGGGRSYSKEEKESETRKGEKKN